MRHRIPRVDDEVEDGASEFIRIDHGGRYAILGLDPDRSVFVNGAMKQSDSERTGAFMSVLAVEQSTAREGEKPQGQAGRALG